MDMSKIEWNWYVGSGEELYSSGPFTCKDEAMQVGRDEIDDGDGYHLIQAVPYELAFSAYRLIDQQYFEMDNYFCGDFGNEHKRIGDYQDADKELQALLDNWLEKYRGTFASPTMFRSTCSYEYVPTKFKEKLDGQEHNGKPEVTA